MWMDEVERSVRYIVRQEGAAEKGSVEASYFVGI